jgi:4-amino-4-deoxy-L-arabinose transferase-like glycosyltransferase
VHSHTHRPIAVFLVLLSCIFFLCAGLLLAPLIGIEGDEPLFVQAMYAPRVELYTVELRQHKIPLMLMTYVGTLKSWIYTPIFRVFGSGVMSLRVPVLLAGAATLWLLYLLLRRIAGDRAGLIGCAILAADSMYLVTTCFDWGPVALQHLLVLGGMLLTLRFYQERQAAALAGGFFLFGLALWDKALALWMLSGLGLGVISTFPRQFFATLTKRRLAVALAVLAFMVGSLPLLIFNINNHWDTFRGNFQLDTSGLGGKAKLLAQTAKGGGLLGWLTAPNWQTPVPRLPHGIIQQASAKISAIAGNPHSSLQLYLFVLALLISPLAGRTALRTIAFCLAVMTVAWLQMALNANTGGSVHHTILMWPLPAIIMAVSLAGVSRRLGRAGIPAIGLLLAIVLGSGWLLTNQYYAEAVRYGGGQSWTDGIYPLSRYLETVPKKYVFTLDWGIADPLRMLNGGRLMLATGNEQTSKPEVSPEDRAIVMRMLTDPDNIYVAHTRAYEMFEGSLAKFLKYAGEMGYAPELIQTVDDSLGRPVYEIYRFKPKA